MKRINLKIAFLTIAAMSIFTACKDYKDTEVPSPAGTGVAVRFLVTMPTEIELKPGKNVTLTLVRYLTDKALDVPIALVGNDNGYFSTPSSVHFNAGEQNVDFTVNVSASMPQDVAIPLIVKISDETLLTYENQYMDGLGVFNGEVTVTSFEIIGTATFSDEFMPFDEVVVDLYQNANSPNIYRISNPYTEQNLIDSDNGDYIGGPNQNYIVYTVTPTDNVTWNKFWYTGLLYDTEDPNTPIKAYLPSALSSSIAADDAFSVVLRDDAGNISGFELYPYYYVDGLGGWGESVVTITFQLN